MELLGLINLPNWILWVTLVVATAYLYYTWHFNVFKKLGIKGPKPYPVIGNFNLIFKHGMREVHREISKEYGKVFGIFGPRNPEIVIGDVNILRKILIKDFPNFVNRRPMPLRGTLEQSIFDVRDSQWKHVRTHLTPALSTGKLKRMTKDIEQCADIMVKHLQQFADNGEVFEAKDVASAFSMDVVGRIVFSLHLNTQEQQNHIFIKQAMKLFNWSFFNIYIFIATFFPFMVPVLKHIFRVNSVLPKDVEDFFRDIVLTLLEERRNSPQKHADLVQMMLDSEEDLRHADDEIKADLGGQISEESKKTGLTKEEIISQCFMFLVGGYETTGTTLGFLFYELATHPDVQEKVFREIDKVIGDKESFTYEDVAKLTYLEMAICETLRLFPSFPLVDRQARCDVEYDGLKIPAGMVVVYPIAMMQKDPEVYPEPEVFKPERFTAEEKAKRDPLYFAAFGNGPRNCAGVRLAMLEVKMAMVKTLRKYRIVACEETQVPLILQDHFFPKAKDGIRIKVQQR